MRIKEGLQGLAKPWHKRRALHVYLDQSVQGATPGLEASLVERMDASRWLLVLLSPASAASPWVSREIEHWLTQDGSAERILLALTEGELEWDDTSRSFDRVHATSVPEPLIDAFGAEPLWVDFRKDKDSRDLSIRASPEFRDKVATLAATVHGVSKDELVGEDLRQFRKGRRLRRAAVVGLTLLTVASVGLGAMFRQQQLEAVRQEAIALENEAEARRQEALATEERNRALARFLASEARSNLRSHPALSVLLGLESVATTDTVEGRGALLGARYAMGNIRLGLFGHTEPVLNMVFSSDQSMLASNDRGGGTVVWDTATGEELQRLTGLDHALLTFMEFSPDGTRLAVAESGLVAPGRVLVWDLESGDRFVGNLGTVFGWTENSQSLVTDQGTFDAVSGDLVSLDGPGTTRPLEPMEHPSAAVDTSDGPPSLQSAIENAVETRGSRLVSVDDEVGTWVWDTDPPHALGPIPVETTALAMGRSEIAIADNDASIWLWASPGRIYRQPVGARTAAVAFVDGGPGIVAVTEEGTVIRQSNPEAPAVEDFNLGGDSGGPYSVSANGRYAAFPLGLDASPEIWDLASRRPTGVELESLDRTQLVWSSSGSLVASFDRTPIAVDTLALHAVSTGEMLGERGLPAALRIPGVSAAAFSPDEKALAVGGGLGDIELWSTTDLGPLDITFQGHPADINDLAYSPDGDLLASLGADQTVRFWDPVSGREIGKRLGPFDDARAMTFASNGATLAVADGLGMSLWDVASRKMVAENWAGSGGDISTLLVDRTGSRIMSWGIDGDVQEWAVGLDPVEWMATACDLVGRNLTDQEWSQFVGSSLEYRRTCRG